MGYAITPEHIARNPRLSAAAKALWQVLATYANGSSDDQRVWPSQETIAGHLGCTDRTVRTLTHELQQFGYVKVEQERTQKGVFSTYILHMGSPRVQVGPEADFRCGPERDRKQTSGADRKQTSGEGSQQEGSGRKDPPVVPQGTADLFGSPAPAGKGKGKGKGTAKADRDSGAVIILDLYRATCPSLPQPRGNVGSAAHTAAARAWTREPDVATWEDRFRRAEASDFLTGRRGASDGRAFKADLLWLCNPTNAEKVDLGRYDNRGIARTARGAAPSRTDEERRMLEEQDFSDFDRMIGYVPTQE